MGLKNAKKLLDSWRKFNIFFLKRRDKSKKYLDSFKKTANQQHLFLAVYYDIITKGKQQEASNYNKEFFVSLLEEIKGHQVDKKNTFFEFITIAMDTFFKSNEGLNGSGYSTLISISLKSLLIDLDNKNKYPVHYSLVSLADENALFEEEINL